MSQSQSQSQSPAQLPDGAACARYSVVHETRYSYAQPVTLSQQYLHLTPRTFAWQRTESQSVTVTPAPDGGVERLDYFGNIGRHVEITAPHTALLVRAESVVTLFARPTLAQITGTAAWEGLREQMLNARDPLTQEGWRFLFASPHVQFSQALNDYAYRSFTPGRPLLEAALDLTRRIFEDFEFDAEATDISTPLEQVLKGRRGVCQDFAQLMIGCLRGIGLPARYMSGYILTHPPPGQPRMIGADASHAWVSVYCPELGWIDFDPTNRCLVQGEHVTLGWGRDFSDVTPMRGTVLGGGEQELQVNVTMTPLVQAA
ncbi:transglutaminase family protein [Oxalobacteraceae bacterium]|nr:transglutaminase family protein [Oxalobacteraceae bacterium]